MPALSQGDRFGAGVGSAPSGRPPELAPAPRLPAEVYTQLLARIEEAGLTVHRLPAGATKTSPYFLRDSWLENPERHLPPEMAAAPLADRVEFVPVVEFALNPYSHGEPKQFAYVLVPPTGIPADIATELKRLERNTTYGVAPGKMYVGRDTHQPLEEALGADIAAHVTRLMQREENAWYAISRLRQQQFNFDRGEPTEVLARSGLPVWSHDAGRVPFNRRDTDATVPEAFTHRLYLRDNNYGRDEFSGFGRSAYQVDGIPVGQLCAHFPHLPVSIEGLLSTTEPDAEFQSLAERRLAAPEAAVADLLPESVSIQEALRLAGDSHVVVLRSRYSTHINASYGLFVLDRLEDVSALQNTVSSIRQEQGDLVERITGQIVAWNEEHQAAFSREPGMLRDGLSVSRALAHYDELSETQAVGWQVKGSGAVSTEYALFDLYLVPRELVPVELQRPA